MYSRYSRASYLLSGEDISSDSGGCFPFPAPQLRAVWTFERSVKLVSMSAQTFALQCETAVPFQRMRSGTYLTGPTPSGVPVRIRSPSSSVMMLEMLLMSWGMRNLARPALSGAIPTIVGFMYSHHVPCVAILYSLAVDPKP